MRPCADEVAAPNMIAMHRPEPQPAARLLSLRYLQPFTLSARELGENSNEPQTPDPLQALQRTHKAGNDKMILRVQPGSGIPI